MYGRRRYAKCFRARVSLNIFTRAFSRDKPSGSGLVRSNSSQRVVAKGEKTEIVDKAEMVDDAGKMELGKKPVALMYFHDRRDGR